MAEVKRGRLACNFLPQADHLDGGDGGLKALVSGLDAGAVEGLLEMFRR